ncbi:hypothetical protein A7A09_012420 [Paracoccus methylarcula]|uniref:dihydrouracil dehydrogenase (NAD(+)) n=1 Tax=Paracoccus methylarcula TaxID=72022 RepID=A0A422QW98_9RHOB|nr:hypothetical protein A7A09_012420 [Paracoccus methylarcula]
MSQARLSPGVAPGRLSKEELAANFADIAPPLDDHEARVAADRCYFCHDAPCVTACPTSIDIPLFIRQIATGTPDAAAMTILHANILGGMCARVCPTENLCEGACVRMDAEGSRSRSAPCSALPPTGLWRSRVTPSAAPSPRASGSPWSARARRGWRLRTGWPPRAMMSSSSRRAGNRAG